MLPCLDFEVNVFKLLKEDLSFDVGFVTQKRFENLDTDPPNQRNLALVYLVYLEDLLGEQLDEDQIFEAGDQLSTLVYAQESQRHKKSNI